MLLVQLQQVQPVNRREAQVNPRVSVMRAWAGLTGRLQVQVAVRRGQVNLLVQVWWPGMADSDPRLML